MTRASTHRPEAHRRAPVKEPVRVATTGNVTISTALNAGDSIDGVTLVAGDRILVWQQSTGSQNGIYLAGASPARDYDLTAADALPGFLVAVLAGSTYGSALFKNTNTSVITVDTTSMTFDRVVAEAINAELNIEGGQSVIKPHGAMGTTETFDPTDGNVHTGTLDDDLTITIASPSGSGAATLLFWITGDGTNTWTWPGSVTWLARTAPTPPADTETTVVVLTSVDGGTNWLGGPWGGAAASSGRWELAVIPGSPPDSLYADGDWLYIEVP